MAFFRKALLQDRMLPARECMEQYYRMEPEMPKIRGRPMHLPRLLMQALRLVEVPFHNWGDMQVLRKKAADDKVWEEMSSAAVAKQVARAVAAEQHRLERAAAQRKRLSAGVESTEGLEPPRSRQRVLENEINETGAVTQGSLYSECTIRHAGKRIRLTVGTRPIGHSTTPVPKRRRVVLTNSAVLSPSSKQRGTDPCGTRDIAYQDEAQLIAWSTGRSVEEVRLELVAATKERWRQIKGEIEDRVLRAEARTELITCDIYSRAF